MSKEINFKENNKNHKFKQNLFHDNIYTDHAGKEIYKHTFDDGFTIVDNKKKSKEKFRKGLFNDYVGDKGTTINKNKIHHKSSSQFNLSIGNKIKNLLIVIVVVYILYQIGIENILSFFLSIFFSS